MRSLVRIFNLNLYVRFLAAFAVHTALLSWCINLNRSNCATAKMQV